MKLFTRSSYKKAKGKKYEKTQFFKKKKKWSHISRKNSFFKNFSRKNKLDEFRRKWNEKEEKRTKKKQLDLKIWGKLHLFSTRSSIFSS